MKTLAILLGLALATVATATIPKIPGYVRIGDSTPSFYAPCAAVPYQPYTNPGSFGGQGYYRYDGNPMPKNGPGSRGINQGQGGATHTLQYGGYDDMTYPIISGLHPPKPFPPPPVSANLCTTKDRDGKTIPLYPGTGCPTATSQAYSRALSGHADWVGGLAAFKKNGHYAEDCQGAPPPAPTVPVTRTPVPKPGTPTPRPTTPPTFCCNQYGFIDGTSAPCPGGTPKCQVPTTTSAPRTPVPDPTAVVKSTPTKTPSLPTTSTTKTPTTSSLTATPFASSSPTPSTGSGGGTSNAGAIALIFAAFGVMVGGIVAGVVAVANKVYAYVAAKVAALKRKL